MTNETRGGEPIQILITTDENYIPPLKVLLTSLRISNPQDEITVYLMHRAVSGEKQEELLRFCEKLRLVFIPVPVGEDAFSHAPVMKQYPREMYFRLLAPHYLPSDISRVLYLDPDTLIINPLRPLWETDMKGCLFAAAAHTGSTEFANHINRIRLKTKHNYFNSGVLLIDLSLGRQQIKADEVFRFIANHKGTLILPDQDVLNILYGSRTLEIDDYLWNYDAQKYTNYFIRSAGKANTEWVMQNTAILHFCGKAKPWKKGYRYRFGALYRHYMNLSYRLETPGRLEYKEAVCIGKNPDRSKKLANTCGT